MSQPQDTSPGALRRTLKPQWVFAIALGSTVGWGVFILPYDWLSPVASAARSSASSSEDA